MRKELTQIEINEILEYDPASGLFTWIKGKRKGKSGGCHDQHSGYVKIRINGSGYAAHRLAWTYLTGEIPDKIDHINHIRHDNRWCNLRNVKEIDNTRNKLLGTRNNSGVIGVSWDKNRNKWLARIGLGGTDDLYIGRFDNFTDAVIARKMKEYELGYHPGHGTVIE